MYGCESWTIKKAEHQRIDAFELWCWRRLLRVPWTARRSNQSLPKEISPGCSLEGLMLNLKLRYFGHLMQRADSLENTLMLGKTEGKRRRGRQRMRWLDGFTDSDMSPGTGDGQGDLAYCSSWGCKVRPNWVTELNWTQQCYICSSLAYIPFYFFVLFLNLCFYSFTFTPVSLYLSKLSLYIYEEPVNVLTELKM